MTYQVYMKQRNTGRVGLQAAVSEEVLRNMRQLSPATGNRCKCCLEPKTGRGEFCATCKQEVYK